MKSGFSILDHPADLGIEAHGVTLQEAFEQSAVGLMSIILDLTTVECREERSVQLNAVDIDHLLVTWLAEILYWYDGQQFVSCRFTIDRVTPTGLAATICGEPLSSTRHRTKLDVKAITYHQLAVHESEEGAMVRVFLDI